MTAPVLVRPPSSVIHDPRDGGRALQVTWHPADGVFVLSIWRDGLCASTFQLTRSDTPQLMSVLAHGLADTPAEWSAVRYEQPPTVVSRRVAKLLAAARRRRRS